MESTSPFPPVQSRANLRAHQSQANRKSWESIIETFETACKAVASEGSAGAIERHQNRGQLLARDRISLLLDPATPFLELCPFAGYGLDDSVPSGNLIAGIGSVCARPCMIISHIPTQNGGAWNHLTIPKQNRVTEIATENNLPIVALVQSAGIFLPQQFRIFHGGGQIFRDLARRSQVGQKSCAVVFGSSTAGGAYQPALSDYSIFVRGQAQVFLGGPPLVKMATGEIIDAEELGGAATHASITGLADQLAEDEFDALRKAREWVASLGPPAPLLTSISCPLPPRHPAEDILALVDPDIRKPFDMLEVLLRIVDDSRLALFKPEFGRNLITTFAHIMGHEVGIIGNRVPVINPPEATKGAQFIRLCNQQDVPIIFLHNCTGFMVGSRVEHAAIINKGAQMVSAVSCSEVPHISIILGASYGAGNYAMCGRSYKPNFMFTWPTGRCSVMGPDQLAGVMETIQNASAKAKGVDLDPTEVKERAQRFRNEVQQDSTCYRTSAMLTDDGIIDPRDTRDVLGMCLDIVTMPGVKGADAYRILARL